jgi:uncharacterized protein HemY
MRELILLRHAHAESAALLTRARLHATKGRLTDAEADFTDAIAILRKSGPRPRLATALRELADVLVAQNRHADAVALLQEALPG